MLGARGVSAVRGAVIVATICSTSLLAFPSSNAPAWGPYNDLDPEFCDSATVLGNPAELEKLPALRQAPASGQLPFAPETVMFKADHEFQVGEGTIGFSLRQSDGRRTEPLDLTVNATFLRIDRRGRVLEVLGEMQRQVSSLKGYETVPFSFDVTGPGLYRAGATFRDSSGKRLGQYGDYFRVLPLIVRPPRLALNAKAFHPRELVLARVENFSTASISYGVPYRIEHWDGATWAKAPESPGRFIKPLYRSGPGSTGPCLPFRIPQTMLPGSYRMVKPIRFESPLFARFEVVPTP